MCSQDGQGRSWWQVKLQRLQEWKHNGNISRVLNKFGGREHQAGKKNLIVILLWDYLTSMFNATSSHKHRFIGTTLRQTMSAALGLFWSGYFPPSRHLVQLGARYTSIWHRLLSSKNLKCCSKEAWWLRWRGKSGHPSQLCYELAVWPCANCLLSLSPYFFILKMRDFGLTNV